MEREHYSLILIGDELSPIRRFDVPRARVRRYLRLAIAVGLLLLLGLADYVRVRIEHLQLDDLRLQTTAQQERIQAFDDTLAGVEAKLSELRELERKIRIIANLPGAAGAGGADVVELGPAGQLPAPQGGEEWTPTDDILNESGADRQGPPELGGVSPAERAQVLTGTAAQLGSLAGTQLTSLAGLIEQLESKRDRLESSPSIWPAKGWLTSRFGMRVSPFTGRPQFHAGLDIAGAPGTEVVAPAKGVVTFAGKRGPLGKALIIDHGHGVRTTYGHNQELLVSRGAQVERGQPIALLGSSGRSTGPHLHYVVEVEGKAKNPLDYIFD